MGVTQKYNAALGTNFALTVLSTLAYALIIFCVVGLVLSRFGLPFGVTSMVIVLFELPAFFGMLLIARRMFKKDHDFW
ncbi:hypothetical protein SAMN05444003_2168 [Cognatiyoonia sediminum]|uniref:Uncharacterized protein n=1 Tax=Cognatiyoonia sediminum TaxID=1508389 RepID=A0A1M5QJZ0_9RHOB|nr:hypothetical protein SAMN05444003_2168 [Cognatiyoonia sediminum]